MRKSLATVWLPGGLGERLEAIAAAHIRFLVIAPGRA
jgi:hypothetical protein